MYWRGVDPSGHTDSLYTLAAVLVFAWLLGVIGVYEAGVASLILLAVTTVLVAIAILRRPTP
jgi:hypothetical protein